MHAKHLHFPAMKVSYPASRSSDGSVVSFSARPPTLAGPNTPGQTPLRVMKRPVITLDRLGEQTGLELYMLTKRMPSFTIWSRFLSFPQATSELLWCICNSVCCTKQCRRQNSARTVFGSLDVRRKTRGHRSRGHPACGKTARRQLIPVCVRRAHPSRQISKWPFITHN